MRTTHEGKIWILCLVLVLCLMVLSACQQQETFTTEVTQAPQTQAVQQEQSAQDLFSGAVVESTNFDDGSYDPASEEGGEKEDVEDVPALPTTAPTIQSDYAGATPVVIDPIDKPTPTPLPPITFTYATYEASALHLTFDAPAGWLADDTQPDSYTLTNPDPSADYAANLIIRMVPVNKNYSKSDLTKEIRGMLDTIKSSGFKSFSPSNTASRTFLTGDGIYANYSGTNSDGVQVAGRVIASCVNKNLYVLHVSYPKGYTETYVEGVFNKFRHTAKLN
ncbi:MAG: hypothetical protein IJJ42_04070 [Clostridia bacterium]|nr:hypothetical protein [Clostridia bacterium]